MVLTESERKQRRLEGMQRKTADMTTVQKIHREFTAGRPPISELRSPAEAVRAAKQLFAELYATMVARKVRDPECAVKVVYVNTDFTIASSQAYIPSEETQLLKLLTDQPVIMIGLVFVMRDPDAKDEDKKIVAGMKPFLLTPQVVGWLRDLISQAHDGMN